MLLKRISEETPSIYLDMTAEENLRQQYRVLGVPSWEEIPELLEQLEENLHITLRFSIE